MQVTTLSTQLGLGSELVDWYRDATTVPFGFLSTDLSPRRDDRLRFCTNSWSVPSKFCIPDRLKHSGTLDDDHTKSLYSPSVPISSPQKQKPLSSVLRKKVFPSARRKLASHKKTSRGKVSRRGLVSIAEKINLEAQKLRSVVRKNIAAFGRHFALVINHLSWYRAVCSCPSSCI